MNGRMQIFLKFLFVLSFLQLNKGLDFRILLLYSSRHSELKDLALDAINNVNTFYKRKSRLVAESLEVSCISTFTGMCQNLTNDGFSMIVDLTDLQKDAYVSSTFTDALQLPSVGFDHGTRSVYDDPQSRQQQMKFLPPARIIIRSVKDVIKHDDVTDVCFILDSSFANDYALSVDLDNTPIPHMYVLSEGDNSSLKAVLENIKDSNLAFILVAMTDTNAEKLFSMANNYKLLTFKFRWFVISKLDDITCSVCPEHYSIISMTPEIKDLEKLPAQQARANVVNFVYIFDMLNLVSKTLENLEHKEWIKSATNDVCFNQQKSTLIKQSLEIIEGMRQVNNQGSFGKFKFTNKENIQHMNMKIERIRFGSEIKKQRLGTWSSERGLTSLNNISSLTKTDLRKRYKVVTIHSPPFMYIERKGDRLVFRGYCKDLMDEIAKKKNFTYDFYEVSDQFYGRQLENGTWTGLVKTLIDGKADIIVAPLSLTAERESVIDFTIPYYDMVGISILMKKPKMEYELFKFMSVLEHKVWFCVLSAFFFISFMLFLFDRYSPYSHQNNRQAWDGDGDEPRIFTLKEGLWFCMTSLTPQGGGEAPKAISGRLVAATWWLFGFIMIATYTANLAAFLTVSRLETPINSMDDLAKQFKTKYAPREGSASQVYFKRMADIERRFYGIWKDMSLNDSMDVQERAKLAVWDYPVSDKFTNLWLSMEQSKFPRSFDEAERRLLSSSEDFAFIGDETNNKYAAIVNCDLWPVGEPFSRKPYALAVQEGNLPLRNELSHAILELLNQRKLEDLKTKVWSKDYISQNFQRVPECPQIEDESKGISIRNIGGVFLVIIMGIGLALIALAFEFYWYKYRKSTKPSEKLESQCHKTKDAENASNSMIGGCRLQLPRSSSVCSSAGDRRVSCTPVPDKATGVVSPTPGETPSESML